MRSYTFTAMTLTHLGFGSTVYRKGFRNLSGNAIVLVYLSNRGEPVPMYWARLRWKLVIFRSWCGLGRVPRKPRDFIPFWTHSMFE